MNTYQLHEILLEAGIEPQELPAALRALEAHVEDAAIARAAEMLRALVERLPARDRVVWLRLMDRDQRPLREAATDAKISHVALIKRTRRLRAKVTKRAIGV